MRQIDVGREGERDRDSAMLWFTVSINGEMGAMYQSAWIIQYGKSQSTRINAEPTYCKAVYSL